MSLIPKDVIIKDLFEEMKNEDERAVCSHCGYMDCVCTLKKERQYDFLRPMSTEL
jgi:hypothetical protein